MSRQRPVGARPPPPAQQEAIATAAKEWKRRFGGCRDCARGCWTVPRDMGYCGCDLIQWCCGCFCILALLLVIVVIALGVGLWWFTGIIPALPRTQLPLGVNLMPRTGTGSVNLTVL